LVVTDPVPDWSARWWRVVAASEARSSEKPRLEPCLAGRTIGLWTLIPGAAFTRFLVVFPVLEPALSPNAAPPNAKESKTLPSSTIDFCVRTTTSLPRIGWLRDEC
jgi:hypothetical protein